MNFISNEEAIVAVFRGEQDLQYRAKGCSAWVDYDKDTHFDIEDFQNGYLEFRKKPKTLKLEIELPKPFKPKVGETFFVIDNGSKTGYHKSVYNQLNCQNMWLGFGAWRTEDEIKIVIGQLRKLKG